MATYLSPSTPQSSRYSPNARNGNGSFYESDGLVPSSPLMRDDTPSSNGLRPSAPSRNASARISRELDNWRQSLALSTAGTEFELDDEDDEEDAEANDIRRSFGPDWSTLTSGKTNKPVKEKEKKKPPEPEDAYSTQELDNILKSAKDQLELLETKVSGARHSLADMPSLASYSPTSASPSSPNRPSYGKLASDENSNRLSRSPRINFGTPRTGSSFSATTDRASKHARNFSETSVPSPQGQVTRGSLAAQPAPRRDAAQRLSLREPNVRHSRLMNSLDPVEEETPTTLKPDDATYSPDKRTSQLSELRGDADQVRNRLSFIQDGVRSAVERRRSWRDGTSAVKPEEVEQIKEVHQLEQMLRRQEQLLGELEQAEGGANGHSHESSLDAWQRYRDLRYSTRDFDDLTDEDDLVSDAGTDYQSVLEEPMLEEVEPDFEESHENRPDAFDYEHFIIHSVLGNSKLEDVGTRSSRSSSTGSARSISTERGPGIDPADPREGSRDVNDLQQPNESVASFETAQSFMNTSDSDSDQEDQTSDEERELLSASGAWPVPPANEARHSLTDDAKRTGRASYAPATAPPVGRAPVPRARPASLVYSAVVDPLGGGARLSEDDEMLIRSLAESVRHACKELQRNQSEPARSDDWRYRLEEARKILSGENELF